MNYNPITHQSPAQWKQHTAALTAAATIAAVAGLLWYLNRESPIGTPREKDDIVFAGTENESPVEISPVGPGARIPLSKLYGQTPDSDIDIDLRTRNGASRRKHTIHFNGSDVSAIAPVQSPISLDVPLQSSPQPTDSANSTDSAPAGSESEPVKPSPSANPEAEPPDHAPRANPSSLAPRRIIDSLARNDQPASNPERAREPLAQQQTKPSSAGMDGRLGKSKSSGKVAAGRRGQGRKRETDGASPSEISKRNDSFFSESDFRDERTSVNR